MRAEYREGERFERLTFTGETFYDCDFSDCVLPTARLRNASSTTAS